MSAAAMVPETPQSNAGEVGFGRFYFRVSACQLATYFVFGVLAYFLLDYRTFMQTGPLSHFMRPLSSKWVAAGPGLQVIRGLILAAALYPIRRLFLHEDLGWLKLWGLFLGLAILAPCGPSPGSVEGLIYTQLSVLDHLRGLPEVVLQTLAFSWLVVRWNSTPKRWLAITIGVIATLALFLSVLGVLAPRPETFTGPPR